MVLMGTKNVRPFCGSNLKNDAHLNLRKWLRENNEIARSLKLAVHVLVVEHFDPYPYGLHLICLFPVAFVAIWLVGSLDFDFVVDTLLIFQSGPTRS